MHQALTVSERIKKLSDRISIEVDRLSHTTVQNNSPTDSLVYVGNWQDAIPRSIWVDPSLSAMDVRSWGIIRTQAIQGSAVMLSINTLLKQTLGYSNASISRVVYVLRLRRWISLCSTLRSQTGQFKGHIYAVHDAPVSLSDAIYLDTDYITFVKRQTGHRNKSIRKLAHSMWSSIIDAVEQGHDLSSSTEVGVQGFLQQLTHPNTKNKQPRHLSHVYKLNPVEKSRIHILNVAGENEENLVNQGNSNQVQKLNMAPICSSRCSSSFFNKTPTTHSDEMVKKPVQQMSEKLIYPQVFNASERKLATMYLQKIEAEFQQRFLDETAAQIQQRSQTSNPIRNPIGYLAWLCKEHNQGNTYLTSAYLNQQKERERKKNLEDEITQQQQQLTQAALTQGGIKALVLNTCKKTENPSDKTVVGSATRWDGLEQSVRPKGRQQEGNRVVKDEE